MICLHTSIPPKDPKIKNSTSPFLNKKMPSSNCEQSHSVIIDIVILIVVVSESGVLFYPYVNLVVYQLFVFFGEVTYVLKDEILRWQMREDEDKRERGSFIANCKASLEFSSVAGANLWWFL
ncbi:hypothetical protein P3L10_001088 [Capsicum annuum]